MLTSILTEYPLIRLAPIVLGYIAFGVTVYRIAFR